MKNGFQSCEAENSRVFQSQRNGTECLIRGLSLDSPHLDLGLFKTVRNLFWTEISCMLLLDMNSMLDVWRMRLLMHAKLMC